LMLAIRTVIRELLLAVFDHALVHNVLIASLWVLAVTLGVQRHLLHEMESVRPRRDQSVHLAVDWSEWVHDDLSYLEKSLLLRVWLARL